MSAVAPNRKTPRPASSRRKRVFWFCFRWFAFVFLLLLLLLGVFGYFLNRLGLPEFIKERVVAHLRSHGWEVQFSRLRLRWYRGLVAEHLQLQRTNQTLGPLIFVEEAQVPLNREALKNLGLQATSVQINGGRFIWPLPAAHGKRPTLAINDVAGLLRFKPDDQWELHSLRAKYRGIQLQLNGTLTNASALRDWTFPQPSGSGQKTAEDWLRQFESTLDTLRLAGEPVLAGGFRGDARDFASFTADLQFAARHVESPWGWATNLLVWADVNLSRFSNAIAQVKASLASEHAQTRWGSARELQVGLQLEHCWSHPIPTNATLSLEADSAQTPWGSAAHLWVTAQTHANATNPLLRQTDFKITSDQVISQWGQATNAQLVALVSSPVTNWLPAAVQAGLQLDHPHTRWGSAQQGDLTLRGSLPATNRLLQTNLSWLERLTHVPLHLGARLTNLSMPKLGAQRAAVTAHWDAPQLQFDLGTEVGSGRFEAAGELNAVTRELSFRCTNSVDPKMIAPAFGTNAQSLLAEAIYDRPPRLQAQGQVVLPAWTNRPPDWRSEVLPTLSLSGQFHVGKSGYRGLEFGAVQTSCALTNLLLQLNRLKVRRAEGELDANLDLDLKTQDFHGRLHSTVDPKMIQPLFQREKERRAFAVVQFTAPPHLEAECWGRWDDWKRLGATARLGATNFAINGQTAKDCLATAAYTNQFFSILAPQIQRAGERGVADGIGIDLVKQRLYLTNAFGNLNPYALLRAINTNTARAIEPYEFLAPPMVRVSGIVGLIAKDNAEDLRFRVEGGSFHWMVFHLPKLSGDVYVRGETARLTNVLGQFYGGQIAGDARFDWSGTNGTDFTFKAKVADAGLHALMTDVSSKTNKVEGLLGGELVITRANSRWPLSWQGLGHVELRNGLIWDFPFFGIFSTVLNSFIPGLGNSRAKQALADFAITNSVIFTKDLDIRATGMRMHFDGKVGFDETVEGRMEAELLRDMPAVGIFIAKIFLPFTKLFEYKVTGTLDQPKAEPLYILPKMVLMPLRPIRTLKELFAPEEPKPLPEKRPPP